jgi:hypothetical protein
MPPQLNDAKQRILHNIAAAGDLPLVARYKNLLVTCGEFARVRVAPCYRHRAWLLRHTVPDWPPPDALLEEDRIVLGPRGGDFAWCATPEPDQAKREAAIAGTRAGYFPPLQEGYRFADISDKALRELLDLCRAEGIPVVLLLSPEGPAFQSWYSPHARRLLDQYCTARAREYQVPLMDARSWLDERDFLDSHHVCLPGAENFTLRLGTEVLGPLVAGLVHPVPKAPVQ